METRWLEQTEADLPASDDWLGPSEAVFLTRIRFAKRRADWSLGRWTAKCAAAAYLDLPRHPQALRKIEIRPEPCGAPTLYIASRPAALTISISHRAGIAVCALAMGGVALGCDLEVIEPRDGCFVADYFTSEEQALIAHAPENDRTRLVTLLWSAKESTLKALREGLRLDTRYVAVTFDAQKDHQHAAGPLLKRWQPLQVHYAGGEIFHGWWQSTGRLVRTLVGAPVSLPPTLLRSRAAFGRFPLPVR